MKRCDVVLMECTYGRPQYVFPPRDEVAGAMVAFARKALEDGAAPVFFAYSLGKAQEAMAILGSGGHSAHRARRGLRDGARVRRSRRALCRRTSKYDADDVRRHAAR